MKQLACLLILLLSVNVVLAQCDAFPNLLQKGDRLLQAETPDYREAINAYTAAIIACPERAGEAQNRISQMVAGIEALKVQAEEAAQLAMATQQQLRAETQRANKALQNAESALQQVQEEQARTQAALTKAEKLLGAFHFYNDRFALTFRMQSLKPEYYFIDQSGEQVDKLGTWEKAQTFDQWGYAAVEKENERYLLDTFGTLHHFAHSIAELKPETTILNLSNQGLEVIPPEVFQHAQLEALFLEHNKLHEIPPEIRHLQHLKTLRFHYNAIDRLPSEIGELQALEVIQIRGNKLSEFPTALLELPRLQHLYIGDNSFSQLPSSIGNISSLLFLDICDLELESLPAEIGQLQELRTLWATDNKLSTLPNEICTLSNLQDLSLFNNSLVKLPKDFNKLSTLRELLLFNNRLTDLPAGIGSWPHLESLLILHNPFHRLPPDLLQERYVNNGILYSMLSFCAEQGDAATAEYLRSHIQNWEFISFQYMTYLSCLLQAGDFEGAIWAGEATQADDRELLPIINSELAAAYLYSGREVEAMDIYKRETESDLFLKTLNDLADKTAADPAAVDRVRAYLEQR
ncbi:MAG: hypothetical protein AAFP77_24025 [Bacteroidota bacterium]